MTSSLVPAGVSGAGAGSDWTRLERAWVLAVALLFLSTGVLKVQAGLGPPGSLTGSERVFGVPMVTWSLVVGGVEVAGVALLLGAPQAGLALRLVRFGFAAIVSYRLLLWWHGGGHCGCLGNLLARTAWQDREGLLLGSLAWAGLVLNEVLAFLRRRRGVPVREIPEARIWVEPGSL